MKNEMTPREQLEKQALEFKKEIIPITDGVYDAVGFDGSTCSMIEGEDGVIMVDTLRGTEGAEAAWMEFRKITDKPVKAIIYTHSHEDHIGGASVFAENSNPEIYCRANFTRDIGKKSPLKKTIMKRGVRQFGRDLPDEDITIRGVAPGRTPTGGFGAGYLPATQMFSEERLSLRISDVDIELVAASGETDDQLYVWLPGKKVLFSGDNYYKAFPNLYAIRGTKYRDVRLWAESLDKMSRENAEFLIPGHTRPVFGAALVKESLENFRDAIRSVYDQTIEAINKGLTPDELVDVVKLPPELADKPYLKEFYGSVPLAARAIFAGMLGWFDGNPTTLFPLSPKEEAQRIINLSGGEETVLSEMETASSNKDWQWVCELGDRIIRLGGPNVKRAYILKTKALRALAEDQINAPARNYYLSCAHELKEEYTDH